MSTRYRNQASNQTIVTKQVAPPSPNIYRIHPAIGIARVGNALRYWPGPQTPAEFFKPVTGNTARNYKDGTGAIIRQAATFRIYEYKKNASLRYEPYREITIKSPDVKDIHWTVEVANQKAKRWGGSVLAPPAQKVQAAAVSKGNDDGRRDFTVGPIADTGARPAIELLGNVLVGREGRLTVLGGFGRSVSSKSIAIGSYYWNDGWYDDVADGPVKAKIIFNDGTELEALSAWVITGPPDFAPGVRNTITLYDVLFDLAVKLSKSKTYTEGKGLEILRTHGILKYLGKEPGFSAFGANYKSDIEPMITGAQKSAILAYGGKIAPTGPFHATLDDPSSNKTSILAFANGNVMPKLRTASASNKRFPLTAVQKKLLANWDNLASPRMATDELATGVPRPEQLDKAALENCAGGAFYPGIEAGLRIFKPNFKYPGHEPTSGDAGYDEQINLVNGPELDHFLEPFRFDPTHAHVKAGFLTAIMALPWQADFLACAMETDPFSELAWWPGQRPIRVGTGSNDAWEHGLTVWEHMVDKWHKLGFITSVNVTTGAITEKERDPSLPAR